MDQEHFLKTWNISRSRQGVNDQGMAKTSGQTRSQILPTNNTVLSGLQEARRKQNIPQCNPTHLEKDRKNVRFKWTLEYVHSFKELKMFLTSEKVSTNH